MDFVQRVMVNIWPLFLLDKLQDDEPQENDPSLTPSLKVSVFQFLFIFLIIDWDWEVTALAKLIFLSLLKFFAVVMYYFINYLCK